MRLRDQLTRFDVRLVGNQVNETQDIGTFRGVGRMVRDFLGVPLPLLGFLSNRREVHDSVNRRTPFMLLSPHDDNARAVRAIAEALMKDLPDPGPWTSSKQLPMAGVDRDDVTQSLRRHPRVNVDWVAAVERGGKILSVRVLDVSAGGVGVLCRHPLADGDRYNVIFNHPRLKLTVPALVRNTEPDSGRVGLVFLADDDTPLRVLKVARTELTAERTGGEPG